MILFYFNWVINYLLNKNILPITRNVTAQVTYSCWKCHHLSYFRIWTKKGKAKRAWYGSISCKWCVAKIAAALLDHSNSTLTTTAKVTLLDNFPFIFSTFTIIIVMYFLLSTRKSKNTDIVWITYPHSDWTLPIGCMLVSQWGFVRRVLEYSSHTPRNSRVWSPRNITSRPINIC